MQAQGNFSPRLKASGFREADTSQMFFLYLPRIGFEELSFPRFVIHFYKDFRDFCSE
jgi:hypothetical protein